MPDIQTLTSAVQTLEASANRWSKGALWLIAATAIVASAYFVVSLVASRKATSLQRAQAALISAKDAQLNENLRRQDEDAKRIEREASEKITTAKSELTKEQAKLAGEQRKTAEAQREAADAQLALKRHLEEVQARVQDRHLTDEQRTKLLAALNAAPKGKIAFLCVSGHMEAYVFMRELQAVFEQAGWRIMASAEQDFLGSPSGLFVRAGDRKFSTGVWESLRAAGLHLTRAAEYKDIATADDNVELIVGLHP